MSVAKLDNAITLSVSVSDRHASADWYAKMLGFELRYHADEVGWSEMSTHTDNVIIGFGEQDEPKPGNSVPVFGTPDLDASRSALEAAGVKFDGDTMVVDGMVELATFYDPDNNALMIAQDFEKDPFD